MQSQPIDNMQDLIGQLEGLRGDLKIQPPVIVNFAMYGDDEDTITINVTDSEE